MGGRKKLISTIFGGEYFITKSGDFNRELKLTRELVPRKWQSMEQFLWLAW